MGTGAPFRRFRGLLLVLVTAYVVGLALLVFGPWGWGLNRLTVWIYAQLRQDVAMTPDWVLPEHYGLLLNVLLFIPLGAGLALLTGRPVWWVVLVAAAGSGLIEATQGLWLSREARWSDLLTNTTGGFLGAASVSLLARARQRAGPRSTSERPS